MGVLEGEKWAWAWALVGSYGNSEGSFGIFYFL